MVDDRRARSAVTETPASAPTDADAPVRTMLDQWRAERPEIDPTPMALFGRLTRADTLARAAIEENLARFGLQRGEYDVLATLRRSGAPHLLSAGRLAAAMLLSPAATTHRLDKLERAGLVERRPDPDDGRGTLAGLTPAGLALVDRATDGHLAGLVDLQGGLTPAQRRELDRLLALFLRTAPGTGDGRTATRIG
ncbi:MarR family winged helix-turn-helix transcriptional regulator [Nakamurella alba]|uniref:MarR family winged helix-turn-helix transcriptional regulator n=1 Tax=Nakamurella alba TaxID=2665158 RepID=UPI002AC34BD4|nr:MarR family transcriptional regulator [Nakamurella alba]